MARFSMLRALVLNILLLISSVSAYSRAECQAPSRNPLSGCPKHTLLVGPTAKFTSVQAAVLSLPNSTTPYTILILPGNYTEQVNVTRPGPLTLLGQTSHPNDAAKNLVNIIWHNATGTATTGTYDNAYTSTLTIAPNFNSSTTGSGTDGNPVPAGTPFGNENFRTYNLNFINDYLPYSAGPSLALSISYANGGFYYTQFLSYQDTAGSMVTGGYHSVTDRKIGLCRQARQRLHVRLYSRRPNRLLLRIRHNVGYRLRHQA